MTNYSAVTCPDCKGTGKTLHRGCNIHHLGNWEFGTPAKWMGKCERCNEKGFIAVDVEKLNKE